MEQGEKTNDLTAEKPFIVELGRKEEEFNGHFLPTARLVITAALRTSGLLQSVAPEELRSLLLLMTYISPHGEIRAFLPNLAEAMHVSQGKARSRLQRLTQAQWAGQPMALEVRHESGLVSFAPTPHLVAFREAVQSSRAEPTAIGGFRERIIAHFRAHYATPRAEVERAIAIQYGYAVEEIDPEAAAPPTHKADRNTPKGHAALELRLRIEALGITTEQARYLLDTYDLERIGRQLTWMPYRRAKKPAAYFIAALENDYAEPAASRKPQPPTVEARGVPAVEVSNG